MWTDSWHDRIVAPSVSADDGPADGGSHRCAEDDVAQVVLVVSQTGRRDITGEHDGWPGEAIPQVTFDHRGKRKRGRRMSGREAVVTPIRSGSLDAELDRLHEHFIDNLGAHQVKAKMRPLVRFGLAGGRREYVTAQHVDGDWRDGHADAADVLARCPEPVGGR